MFLFVPFLRDLALRFIKIDFRVSFGSEFCFLSLMNIFLAKKCFSQNEFLLRFDSTRKEKVIGFYGQFVARHW